MTTHLLLVAKAPVAGEAKTRLGASVGMEAAADLAAAALLDTIEACNAAFGARCHLALAGDLTFAHRGEELREATAGWDVFAQQGDGFAARLAHAHRTVAESQDGPVLQIGMDTPQLTADQLGDAARELDAGAEVVIGPAADGGWWASACRRGDAAALADVPMSQPTTYDDTVRALCGDRRTHVRLEVLRDVDSSDDAAVVAGLAPRTRFAQEWTARSVLTS